MPEPLVVSFGIALLALIAATSVPILIWIATRRLAVLPAQGRRAVLTSAAVIALWMLLLASLAASGVLGQFELRPPPMALAFASVLLVGLGLGLSKYGAYLAAGLPFSTLVLTQTFRLPLELVMHEAALAGVMPRVMSYEGYNFDILSGASALLVGSILRYAKLSRASELGLVAVWNALGSLLLFAIVVIALAASPIFRAFGDQQLNIWVTRFPFVWIVVLVAAALLGHVVIWRKLALEWRKSAAG